MQLLLTQVFLLKMQEKLLNSFVGAFGKAMKKG